MSVSGLCGYILKDLEAIVMKIKDKEFILT